MLRTLAIGLLTLTSLTATGQAQIVSIQTPRVAVKIGPNFIPGVSVTVPGQVPPVVDPIPVAPPPRPLPVMPPADGVPVPAPVVLRPMTHQEFAACFKPT